MIQLNLSDKDAKSLIELLSSAADFYPKHAVNTRDQDTGRQIKKMLNKLKTIIDNEQQNDLLPARRAPAAPHAPQTP